MKIQRLWAPTCQIMVVFCLLIFSAQASAAKSADALGNQSLSSPLTPRGKWTKMRVNSFEGMSSEGKAGSIFDQCIRSVDVFDKHFRQGTLGMPDDVVEELRSVMVVQNCFTYRDKVEHPDKYPSAERCSWEMVDDGVVFFSMNGLINGRHGVTELVEKAHGRPDKALVCPFDGNVKTYWFRDDPGRSCNNVGFVLFPPVKKEEVGELVCFNAPFDGNDSPSEDWHFHLDGVYHESSCNRSDAMYTPSLSVNFDNESGNSSGSTEVCLPKTYFNGE